MAYETLLAIVLVALLAVVIVQNTQLIVQMIREKRNK